MRLLVPKIASRLLKLLLIYLALSIGLLLLPRRWTGPARSAALYPFGLAQRATLHAVAPLGKLADLWRAGRELRETREQVATLRAQLVREAELRYAAESRLAEIGRLPAEAQARAVSARLMGYNASPLRCTAEFDSGARCGVARNSPVLHRGAVAGRVESVGPWSCTAVLLGDRQCRLAVRCARSRVQGVLEGIGAGLSVVKYIDLEADVRQGDIFVTSGTDGIFPPGLLVGDCVEVATEIGGLFKWIVVRPASDAAQLEHVSILLPPTQSEE